MAQLQLQFVDSAEHLGMKLFYHRRITREALRVEALHLAYQVLNLLERCGIVLGQVVQLVQLLQPLSVSSFRVGRYWRVIRSGPA